MNRHLIWLGVAVLATSLAVTSSGLARAGSNGTGGSLVYDAKVGKRAQLFTVDAQGGAARQLTDFTDSDATWGEWSPDGNRIAFERDVRAGVFVSRALIATLKRDGSDLRVLTPRGFNGQPSWWPDGKLIVCGTLQRACCHERNKATISVIPAAGGAVRVVFRGRGYGLGSATFSPDGTRIAFVWHK